MAAPRNQVSIPRFADPYGGLAKTFSNLSTTYNEKAAREDALALREKENKEAAIRYDKDLALKKEQNKITADRYSADLLLRQNADTRATNKVSQDDTVGNFWANLSRNNNTPALEQEAVALAKDMGATDENISGTYGKEILEYAKSRLFQREVAGAIGRDFYSTEGIGNTPFDKERVVPFVTNYTNLNDLQAREGTYVSASQKQAREAATDEYRKAQLAISAYRALDADSSKAKTLGSLMSYDLKAAAMPFEGKYGTSGRVYNSPREDAMEQGRLLKTALIASPIDGRVGVAIMNDFFADNTEGGDLTDFAGMDDKAIVSYMHKKYQDITGSDIKELKEKSGEGSLSGLAKRIKAIASGEHEDTGNRTFTPTNFIEQRRIEGKKALDKLLKRGSYSPAAPTTERPAVSGSIEEQILNNIGNVPVPVADDAPVIEDLPVPVPDVAKPSINIPPRLQRALANLQQDNPDIVSGMDLDWTREINSWGGLPYKKARSEREVSSQKYLELYQEVLEARDAKQEFINERLNSYSPHQQKRLLSSYDRDISRVLDKLSRRVEPRIK